MNRPLKLFTAITLPILFLIGCATTDTSSLSESITDDINHEKLANQTEKQEINHSVKLAISNMEGYQQQLEEEQIAEQSEEIEAVSETKKMIEVATNEEESDMTVLIIEDAMDISETTDALSPTESAVIDQQIAEQQATDITPDKTDFFFGFNKAEPSDADKEALTQHAQYLLKHPSLVLVVSGHADNRGNKNYNQYLSELRAQNVASILMAAGVPEHQLRVGGMGDNVPMANERNWAENRRVELRYRDVMMLSSQ